MKKYIFLYLLFSCYFSSGQTYYYYFHDASNILIPEFFEMSPHKICSQLCLPNYEDFYNNSYSQKNISKVIRKAEDDSEKSMSVYLYDKGYIIHEEHYANGANGDTSFSFVCNYKYNKAKNEVTAHATMKRRAIMTDLSLSYFFDRNFQIDSLAFEIGSNTDKIKIVYDSLNRIIGARSKYSHTHFAYVTERSGQIEYAAERIKLLCKNDTFVINSLNRFLSASTNLKSHVMIHELEPTTDMLYSKITKSFLSVSENKVHFVYGSRKDILIDLWINYMDLDVYTYTDLKLFELSNSGDKIIEETFKISDTQKNINTLQNKGIFKDGLLLKYENNNKKKVVYSYF